MDRRIRVKCPECAASIEMRVDQQELLDVTCPRCQKPFTAKVPPPALDILPVIEPEPEPEEARPAVRPTRVVQQTPATRPRRIREIPQRSASKPTVAPAAFEDTSWQVPTAHYQPGTPYQPAPRVSGATHVKAFLIAGASVLGVGLLGHVRLYDQVGCIQHRFFISDQFDCSSLNSRGTCDCCAVTDFDAD